MVKAKDTATLEKRLSPDEEIARLRAENEQLVAEKEAREMAGSDSYTQEIENLRKNQNKGSLNEVVVKEIAPKMISLWHVSGHNVGKRVGPMQIDLAEETLLRFKHYGIRLSSKRPTEEWIEKYKITDEYKKSAEAEIKRRKLKGRSTRQTQIEALTEAIAKSQGIDPKQLNAIKDQSEVKGLK